MLKKLRLRFIAITMLLVGLVLVAVLGSSFYVNYSTQQHMIADALEREIDRDYDFRPRFGDRDRGAVEAMPLINIEISSDGILLTKDIQSSADEDVVGEIVETALASKADRGSLPNEHLAWRMKETDDGYRISIVDTNMRDEILKSQAVNSILIFIGAMLGVFALAWLFSKLALRPVEDAWNKQRRFIADASHELKTPLTVILANTQILSSDKSLSQESKEWLKRTQDEAQHMNELVVELLELARADEAEENGTATALVKEDVDLSELVSMAALEFDALAFERNCSIETDIDEGIHVMGDATSLSRACKTLIDNATKYAQAESIVNVSLKQQAKTIVYRVDNVGEVISVNDLNHIFDRFYRSDQARTREKTGGFGLGLAIAKSIVETHGGTIDATSKDGNTSFIIRL